MRKINYVEPEEFYGEVCKYLEDLKRNPEARISEKLGYMIYKTVEGLASRGNFRYYQYVDEMISLGVFYVLKYLKNYDINYPNPFKFVNKQANWAFLQVINKEHKHLYTKRKLQLDNNSVINASNSTNNDIEKGGSDLSKINDFVENYERKLNKKSTKH